MLSARLIFRRAVLATLATTLGAQPALAGRPAADRGSDAVVPEVASAPTDPALSPHAVDFDPNSPDAIDLFDRLGVPEALRETIWAERLFEEERSWLITSALRDTTRGPHLPLETHTTWLPKVSLVARLETDAQGHGQEALLVAEVPSVVRRQPQPNEPSPQAIPSNLVPSCLSRLRLSALEQAGLARGRGESLRRRARAAAWLPVLLVRAERRLGRNESVDRAANLSGRAPLDLDTTNVARLEARATWDLPRLVFSPHEVQIQGQMLRAAQMRRELSQTVNQLFFERRRAAAAVIRARQQAEAHPEAAPATLEGALIRLAELDAELDALTGLQSGCR